MSRVENVRRVLGELQWKWIAKGRMPTRAWGVSGNSKAIFYLHVASVAPKAEQLSTFAIEAIERRAVVIGRRP